MCGAHQDVYSRGNPRGLFDAFLFCRSRHTSARPVVSTARPTNVFARDSEIPSVCQQVRDSKLSTRCDSHDRDECHTHADDDGADPDAAVAITRPTGLHHLTTYQRERAKVCLQHGAA